MKIEGTGEVQAQVEGETQVVEEAQSETPQVEEQEEVVLPSDEGEELIAGKFKTQDDLLKAYKELESKLGQPKEEVVEEQPTETDPEYEAYKQEKAKTELLKDVGGIDTYNKAAEWAKENLPQEDIDLFNAAIKEAEGKSSVLKSLARSLIDKYNTSNNTPTPKEPIHAGETTKPPQNKGYETKSDMMKDMRDPRYEKDEGFRQKVAAKLAVTDEAKWYSM